MGRNGAVIFDMDGVMVHTAPQYFAAWGQVFAEMGWVLSEGEGVGAQEGRILFIKEG
jgi:beta-phosphoglucomutase-like phosphatase (HAD superfamily)